MEGLSPVTRRVVIGALPTGGFGLRVSPPGVDVFTAADDQLVFSSEWSSMFPIFASGVTGYITPPSDFLVSYPDLGYIPFGGILTQLQGATVISPLGDEFFNAPYKVAYQRAGILFKVNATTPAVNPIRFFWFVFRSTF